MKPTPGMLPMQLDLRINEAKRRLSEKFGKGDAVESVKVQIRQLVEDAFRLGYAEGSGDRSVVRRPAVRGYIG